MRAISCSITLVVTVFLLTSCSPKRPVLYPNEFLKQVGPAQAELDIDACIRMANEFRAGGDKTEQIAKDTGKSAVVGAATGAVVGAIAGDAGMGAAIGGAGAATAALGAGIMRSDEPDPIFQRFVDQCLYDKGYQIIGWK